MKNYFYAATLIILASCSAAKFVPAPPTQADADRIASKYPGITVEELNLGKQHYEAQCATCHGLKNPVKWNETQWKSIVPKMAEKANKKAKKEVVDNNMQESILKYVIAMSTSGKKSS
jgi:cytochrome c5